MEVYTIGFTKKTAEQFFEILRKENIRRLLECGQRTESRASPQARLCKKWVVFGAYI